MSDINIVLKNRDDIRVAVEEKDINVEVPAGKDGRSLRPRGEWSADAAYAYLDLVSYQGSSYVATKAVPAGTLPTDTSYWMLSAEKGEPGGAVWGAITGDLSDQTDLQNALDAKADVIISSASGSIASFTDGSPAPVTALSVAIEPVQDLHGYDNPWPAGGGKNILVGKTLSETVRAIDFSFTSDDVLTFSGTNSSASAMAYFNIYPNESGKRVPIKSGIYTFSSKTALPTGAQIILGFKNQDGTSISSLVLTNSRQSVSGTIAVDCEYSLYISVSASATVSYNGGLQLESGSSASSWAPYSNICPISGWSSATVTRTGKNLLDPSILYKFGSTYIATNNYGSQGTIQAKPSTTYTLSVNLSNSGKDGKIYSFNASGIRTQISGSWNQNAKTFTTPSDCVSLSFYCLVNDIESVTDAQPMLELGSTASSFEPYDGISVTIDLDGTRYGGTLNVLTGEMTVDRVKWIPTIISSPGTNTYGITNWTFSGSNFNNVSTIKRNNISSLLPYQETVFADTSSEGFSISNMSVGYIRLKAGRVTTVAEANTWVASNDFYMVLYLATPLTVQLSPSQLSTLLGQNNVWADTGDVSVEYRADTKLFVQGQIAQTAKVTRQMIADSATADGKAPKSLATGDLIIVGDELRKATANIGNGSAITASNSTIATLADVIKALQ